MCFRDRPSEPHFPFSFSMPGTLPMICFILCVSGASVLRQIEHRMLGIWGHNRARRASAPGSLITTSHRVSSAARTESCASVIVICTLALLDTANRTHTARLPTTFPYRSQLNA